jgi:chorismate mutase
MMAALNVAGMRITAAEITRDKNEVPTGLSINMAINNLRMDGEQVEISFTYRAEYAENVGMLRLEGTINILPGSKKQAEEMVKSWKDKKKLDDEIAEEVLNNINFACGAHGTLMARVVNLQPPMMPPRIRIDKQGAGASAA